MLDTQTQSPPDHSGSDDAAAASLPLPALDRIAAGRDYLTTAEAADYFGLPRRVLYLWSCHGTGPVQPVRLPGLRDLLWPVAGIRAALTQRAPRTAANHSDQVAA